MYAILTTTVTCQSSISYDTVLVIVIIELVFAFSIGLICILFSYNLFRAIKESESAEENEVQLQLEHEGSIPSSFGNEDYHEVSGNYGSFDDEYRGEFVYEDDLEYGDEHDSDLDYENVQKENIHYQADQQGPVSIMKSFTRYLRLW